MVVESSVLQEKCDKGLLNIGLLVLRKLTSARKRTWIARGIDNLCLGTIDMAR